MAAPRRTIVVHLLSNRDEGDGVVYLADDWVLKVSALPEEPEKLELEAKIHQRIVEAWNESGGSVIKLPAYIGFYFSIHEMEEAENIILEGILEDHKLPVHIMEWMQPLSRELVQELCPGVHEPCLVGLRFDKNKKAGFQEDGIHWHSWGFPYVTISAIEGVLQEEVNVSRQQVLVELGKLTEMIHWDLHYDACDVEAFVAKNLAIFVADFSKVQDLKGPEGEVELAAASLYETSCCKGSFPRGENSKDWKWFCDGYKAAGEAGSPKLERALKILSTSEALVRANPNFELNAETSTDDGSGSSMDDDESDDYDRGE